MEARLPVSRRFEGFAQVLVSSLDWRLLVIWVVAMLLPAAIAALPMWRSLANVLDASPFAPELARRFDLLLFDDLANQLHDARPALGGAFIVASAISLITSRFATAVILARASDAADANGAGRVDFSSLLQRGIAWYGRSMRIWLVSLLPAALVVTAGLALAKQATSYAESALLESQADLVSRLALAASILLGVLLHVSIEAGRAELALEPERRSALLAWLRGSRKVLRWPLATLTAYLLTTLPSLALAAVLTLVRVRLTATSGLGFGLSLLVTQLIVASIGWGRVGRLFALVAVFRAESAG